MTMLPAHKRLFGIAVAIAVAAGAAWYVFVRPLREQVSDLEDDIKRQEKDLKTYGYPLSPGKLEALRGQLLERRAVIQRRMEAVYDVSMRGFDENIKAYGNSVEGFRRAAAVSTVDYLTRYAKLRNDLAAKGIHLDERVLNLSTRQAGENYRQVTYLWVIRDLAERAVAHKLDLKATTRIRALEGPEGEEGELFYPARITVLPFRTYVTAPDKPPFMEEYPVRITCRGKIQDVCDFLLDLTREPRWLPLQHVLVYKDGVEQIQGDLGLDQVEATITCSGFLMLKERGQLFDAIGRMADRQYDPARAGN